MGPDHTSRQGTGAELMPTQWRSSLSPYKLAGEAHHQSVFVGPSTTNNQHVQILDLRRSPGVRCCEALSGELHGPSGRCVHRAPSRVHSSCRLLRLQRLLARRLLRLYIRFPILLLHLNDGPKKDLFILLRLHKL